MIRGLGLNTQWRKTRMSNQNVKRYSSVLVAGNSFFLLVLCMMFARGIGILADVWIHCSVCCQLVYWDLNDRWYYGTGHDKPISVTRGTVVSCLQLIPNGFNRMRLSEVTLASIQSQRTGKASSPQQIESKMGCVMSSRNQAFEANGKWARKKRSQSLRAKGKSKYNQHHRCSCFFLLVPLLLQIKSQWRETQQDRWESGCKHWNNCQKDLNRSQKKKKKQQTAP